MDVHNGYTQYKNVGTVQIKRDGNICTEKSYYARTQLQKKGYSLKIQIEEENKCIQAVACNDQHPKL